MTRPRSIVGLLATLGWLHVRRRPVFIASIVAGGVAVSRFSDDAAPASHRLVQAAVLADGFAILEGNGSDRHVLGFDDEGQRRFRRAVPLTAPDVRVVGTSAGPAVGWRETSKLKLALLTGDGELGNASSWGKSVRFQCEGIVSNEHRFGLGWADKDNRVWFVGGPVSKTRSGEEPTRASTSAAASISWCGIASAHQEVALFWREGTSTYVNFCSAKSCSGLVVKLPIDNQTALLGFGCTKDNCVLATRKGGELRLAWVGPTGKLAWTKTVTDAAPDTTFSIVGAGDRAIAVGYATNTGATALRVIASGSMVRAWHDPAANDAPSLAWARDRLLVAHRHGDAIAPEIVPLPR